MVGILWVAAAEVSPTVHDPGQPVAGQCWRQRNREAPRAGWAGRGSEVSLGSVFEEGWGVEVCARQRDL